MRYLHVAIVEHVQIYGRCNVGILITPGQFQQEGFGLVFHAILREGGNQKEGCIEPDCFHGYVYAILPCTDM